MKFNIEKLIESGVFDEKDVDTVREQVYETATNLGECSLEEVQLFDKSFHLIQYGTLSSDRGFNCLTTTLEDYTFMPNKYCVYSAFSEECESYVSDLTKRVLCECYATDHKYLVDADYFELFNALKYVSDHYGVELVENFVANRLNLNYFIVREHNEQSGFSGYWGEKDKEYYKELFIHSDVRWDVDPHAAVDTSSYYATFAELVLRLLSYAVIREFDLTSADAIVDLANKVCSMDKYDLHAFLLNKDLEDYLFRFDSFYREHNLAFDSIAKYYCSDRRVIFKSVVQNILDDSIVGRMQQIFKDSLKGVTINRPVWYETKRLNYLFEIDRSNGFVYRNPANLLQICLNTDTMDETIMTEVRCLCSDECVSKFHGFSSEVNLAYNRMSNLIDFINTIVSLESDGIWLSSNLFYSILNESLDSLRVFKLKLIKFLIKYAENKTVLQSTLSVLGDEFLFNNYIGPAYKK